MTAVHKNKIKLGTVISIGIKTYKREVRSCSLEKARSTKYKLKKAKRERQSTNNVTLVTLARSTKRRALSLVLVRCRCIWCEMHKVQNAKQRSAKLARRADTLPPAIDDIHRCSALNSCQRHCSRRGVPPPKTCWQHTDSKRGD